MQKQHLPFVSRNSFCFQGIQNVVPTKKKIKRTLGSVLKQNKKKKKKKKKSHISPSKGSSYRSYKNKKSIFKNYAFTIVQLFIVVIIYNDQQSRGVHRLNFSF